MAKSSWHDGDFVDYEGKSYIVRRTPGSTSKMVTLFETGGDPRLAISARDVALADLPPKRSIELKFMDRFDYSGMKYEPLRMLHLNVQMDSRSCGMAQYSSVGLSGITKKFLLRPLKRGGLWTLDLESPATQKWLAERTLEQQAEVLAKTTIAIANNGVSPQMLEVVARMQVELDEKMEEQMKQNGAKDEV